LLYRTIKGLTSKTLIPVPQDESQVSLALKFKKEDGEIDWTKTSFEIHNQIRAFSDSSCAFVHAQDKVLKIMESRLIENPLAPTSLAGQVIGVSKDGIEVKTGDSSILITKVKSENKATMSAYDWSNGARIKAGFVFESKECEKCSKEA